MAFNLFLVVYFNKTAKQTRRFEWGYLFLCWFLTAGAAIAPVFLVDDIRGPIYGEADLW
jgi:hypothetical protein